MLRSFALLWQMLFLLSGAAAQQMDLSAWAAQGEELPAPDDSRELARRYLEWDYLVDWTRAELRGQENDEAALRWARLRRMRLGEAGPPTWELVRLQRGLCVYEHVHPGEGELAAFCDSLLAFHQRPEAYILEGLLLARLLTARHLPACGSDGDPGARLSANLPRIPSLDLEELKQGRDFAAMFFAAENEIEARRVSKLARVQEFLERPGVLISLKYGFHKIEELSSPVEPERLGEKHLLYPEGLSMNWGKGRLYSVSGLPVLHNTEQHLLQIKEGHSLLSFVKGEQSISPEIGEYELRGAYVLETEHLRIDINGGRYRRDENELRIWWPDSFFASNKSGLLMALLILVVTMILLANIQRQKRELARPVQIRRPKR